MVLPLALGLFLFLAVFGGIRYAAQKVQDETKKWLPVMLLLIAVLAIGAFAAGRATAADDAPEPAPAVAGE